MNVQLAARSWRQILNKFFPWIDVVVKKKKKKRVKEEFIIMPYVENLVLA